MPPAKPFEPQSPCPCGSHKSLADCCLAYIQGDLKAPTAEALMRSRYTAHVLVEADYLWDTWSAQERIRSSKHDIRRWAESCEWLGLQIIDTKDGGEEDADGLVTFTAIYRQNGQIRQHHEISVFKKTPQGWRYIDHKG